MSTTKSPSEIARETLIALAAKKLAPTPEHFAQMYRQISGEKPASTPAEASDGKTPPHWSKLIKELLRQLDTPHKGLTVTRKKEGVETVLSRFSSDPGVLHEKLQSLMRSWSAAPTGTTMDELVPDIQTSPASSATTSKIATLAPSAGMQELTQHLREMLAQTLENLLPTHPELETEVHDLCSQIRTADSAERLNDIAKKLRQFWLRLELRGIDKGKIQEGLVRLVRLLVENVGEMVEDDKWLHGQIIALQEIIAKPLDKHTIADAERSLRHAVIRQGMLQQSLSEAKATLKSLMSSFIDRLGDLTASTGEYHSKLEVYSEKIGKASHLADLGSILKDVMQDTRMIQSAAMRSHEELLSHKKQAEEAEAKIRQLEQELEQVSELVREDQLTGALNRRGLDEAVDRELKRSDRNRSPVSVALLDIDNFKKLNDTLGHQAGDQALVHLAKVVKETLRPADTVGRYGGEEFLIILPDTPLNDGVAAIQRLQRELTKKFFMHQNDRLLITFSAGVALRKEGEDAIDLVARADKAMYHAKQTGKNRVVAAE